MKIKFNKHEFIYTCFPQCTKKGEQLLVFLKKFMSVNVKDLNTYVLFSLSI